MHRLGTSECESVSLCTAAQEPSQCTKVRMTQLTRTDTHQAIKSNHQFGEAKVPPDARSPAGKEDKYVLFANETQYQKII
ncbi:hypothetical protein [Lentimonas sp. CC4]|uniref:hypothetical protein n=1 Tax=Lentimonas sp. CC4 TaxID=2676099 RepID=UPI001329BDD2|nr:hypothetical protein [Lentimonas sp. CC4]CAA6684471.1 Unannotated [Lentimonas sp. CC6]CAA7171284.1 Unannotated [Lentimonas sp. CC21]CAA7183314.1 Unannotated [Lentimonas sp. CC8]CAA6678867.1 Unannotated [Lentimonas sp. CC4]CAA7077449.1 Unannotated [Lentimonas sp. CC4]